MPVSTFGEVTKTVFRVIDSETSKYPDVASYSRRFALDCIGLGGFVCVSLAIPERILKINANVSLLQSFDMGSVENPNSKYAVIYHQAFGTCLSLAMVTQ